MKPCPFCGGSETYQPRTIQPVLAYAKYWVVQCSNCDSMGGPDSSESAAIDGWNMRGGPL